jgi:hypothetical protein
MIILLILIEMGVFPKCSKFSLRSMPWRDDIVKPEDVQQEEDRIRKDDNIQDLRVVELCKVYTSLIREP